MRRQAVTSVVAVVFTLVLGLCLLLTFLFALLRLAP